MSLRLLHRRLAVLMGVAGLVAFAGGAGFEPFSAGLAAAALTVALLWQPSARVSARMEQVWIPMAAVLVTRALIHVFLIGDDVVIPVVDLLLLLLAAEALRSLDAPNDIRMYALSFALLLASTAYRPGILFLLALLAYVPLATLAMTVGHLRRRAERYNLKDVSLGSGVLWAATKLSLVIFVTSGAVFLAFPRSSRGWAGRGDTVARSIAGFSDQISLGEHGARIYGNPQVVLRVEFPGGIPDDPLGLHWRGRSYDRFDGIRWTRSESLPPSSAPRQWYRERWDGPLLEQRIYGAPLDVRVLFAVHPAVGIEAENGIQPLFDNAGDFIYWGSGAPAYTARSRREAPSPAALREAESGYRPEARFFLQLPDLDARIVVLADSLTAGMTTRYDKAMAVQRWLRSFRYTLELPPTAREATLEHFLFQRRAGHCEYFSTAMVVLLRAVGVEARNVNGFLGGEWNQFGNYLAVTQNQAHSWVEVWFPGYGWVTFDPTPGGVGAGERATSWYWPGRVLLDGIQHRWSKWVLDYDVEMQSGLMGRWAHVLRPTRPADLTSGVEDRGQRRIRGAMILALALSIGFWWSRRGTTALSPEVRMYLGLRTACGRAGLPLTPGVTPLALLERLRLAHAGAAGPASRVVDLYLRARYGGEALGRSELHEMSQALATTRRLLPRGALRMERGAKPKEMDR
jgi:transglutaminase-like putative cysteine protease